MYTRMHARAHTHTQNSQSGRNNFLLNRFTSVSMSYTIGVHRHKIVAQTTQSVCITIKHGSKTNGGIVSTHTELQC